MLLYLAWKCIDDAAGRCSPTEDKIIGAIGVGRSAVVQAIGRLVDGKWITREVLGHTRVGRPIYTVKNRPAVYYIADPLPVDASELGPGSGLQSSSGWDPDTGPNSDSWDPDPDQLGPGSGHLRKLKEVDRSTRARAHTRTREAVAPGRNISELAEAKGIVARNRGCNAARAAEIVAKIDNSRIDNLVAFVKSTKGRAKVDAAAEELDQAATAAEVHAEFERRKANAGLCEHGYPDFNHPETELPACCGICRKRAKAEAASVPQLSQRPKRRSTA